MCVVACTCVCEGVGEGGVHCRIVSLVYVVKLYLCLSHPYKTYMHCRI